MQDNMNSSPDNSLKSATAPEFYVVSLNKFLILFLGTAGLYMTYWFYQQWVFYKQAHKGDEWPVIRATFPVFFVPSLFKKLTDIYERKSGNKSDVLKKSTLLFIIVTVISFLCDNVPVSAELRPYISLLSIATIPLFCWLCYQAQWFVNYACDDINGASNANYTVANYIWLAIGAMVWCIYIYYVFTPIPVPDLS
ncbi:hypothetical protein E2R68_04345 [Psychromonas sp. RZ22]|uniref:hypothetical protein n=1 Tax=Psychromonas algarum TaxID=2555643 RepID=UPI0010686EE1|nr:hypothetical protein [Psychromonas sp. RZ22]TEW55620.1 hypothetical protein E2R68_04345 [Psychromonas sp. RZ22]